MVWFDGLDLPLLHHLDSMFFELAGPDADGVAPLPTVAAITTGAMAVLGPDPDADAGAAQPNRYRYSWTRAALALADAPVSADGCRWLRYVDTRSGGAVLPTLDCYLLACAPGRATDPYRSTSNAICVVARGRGSSQVGSHAIDWQRNDVFTLPHWNWISHTALSDDAVIFMMTDRAFLAMMGYLREERRS